MDSMNAPKLHSTRTGARPRRSNNLCLLGLRSGAEQNILGNIADRNVESSKTRQNLSDS